MLKEDILKLSGNKEVLTEGVKYFQFSKRIQKTIEKAEKSKEEGKERLIVILKKAKKDFEEAERVYETNKEKGKELYTIAKKNNKKALKSVLTKETKSFILRAGIFGAIATILVFLGINNQEFLSNKFERFAFDIENNSKNILNELKYIGREKDQAYFDKRFELVLERSKEATKDFIRTIGKESEKYAKEGFKGFEKLRSASEGDN